MTLRHMWNKIFHREDSTSSAWNLRMMMSRVASGEQIRKTDAMWLAEKADLDFLLFVANIVRRRFCGDVVHLCSIINAKSGACSEDCRFCAQSGRHRTGIERYPLVAPDAMAEAARTAAERGADCFGIVTSGESTARNAEDFEAICGAVSAIAVEGRLGRSCVSIGSLSPADVERLKAAGIRRIHHNLETSRRFFPQVCTTHTYDSRVETVRNIKAAGLEACSGGLFGLGETWEDRVDLALELRALRVDSVPVNFLTPIEGTPMGGRPMLDPREALRIIAVLRFALADRQIQICGGRTAVLRDLQSWVFAAGASGMMTGDYLTTKGRTPAEDLAMIRDLGLRPAGEKHEEKS